ncbi:MAG: hypothetical protein EPO00_11145 [Chloroflexota bacterium]|nr:MAG: hypothetical protein EPO00_11145 [Chloroflexota bacterium]
MTAAALLNPDAAGMRTDNGELIGAFTANGTLALVIFGGLFGGIAAGICWAILSPWVPGSGWRRAVLVGPLAMAIGGSFLVRGDNTDFAILEGDALILALLLGLVVLIGISVARLDDLFERRLPRPAQGRFGLTLAYGLVALAGLLFLPLTIGFFFSVAACDCSSPPIYVGWALVVVAAITVLWWAVRLATGRSDPGRGLVRAGRLGVAGAAIAGVFHLIPQLVQILRFA